MPSDGLLYEPHPEYPAVGLAAAQAAANVAAALEELTGQPIDAIHDVFTPSEAFEFDDEPYALHAVTGSITGRLIQTDCAIAADTGRVGELGSMWLQSFTGALELEAASIGPATHTSDNLADADWTAAHWGAFPVGDDAAVLIVFLPDDATDAALRSIG